MPCPTGSATIGTGSTSCPGVCLRLGCDRLGSGFCWVGCCATGKLPLQLKLVSLRVAVEQLAQLCSPRAEAPIGNGDSSVCPSCSLP